MGARSGLRNVDAAPRGVVDLALGELGEFLIDAGHLFRRGEGLGGVEFGAGGGEIAAIGRDVRQAETPDID
ncbi:MAG: hypothetical protein V4461_07635 [Pseudomonadota bacterium]